MEPDARLVFSFKQKNARMSNPKVGKKVLEPKKLFRYASGERMDMEELAQKLKEKYGSHERVSRLLGLKTRTYFNVRHRTYKNSFILRGIEAEMKKLLRNNSSPLRAASETEA